MIADGIEHSLDPRWVSLDRVHNAISTGVQTVIAVIVVITLPRWTSVEPGTVPVLLGALGVLAGLKSWWAYRWSAVAYRHQRYTLTETELEIRRGVWWQSVVTVPRSRVQHTDVSQGPLDRRYGLGTLVIHTAGTRHAAVALPGLDREVAHRIRDHLLPTAGGDEV